LCINKQAIAYYTEDMSRELDRILGNIHAKQEFVDIVHEFREKAVKLDGVPRAEQRTVDPDDQKFVDCAATAGADYLISSDDHLLSLEHLDRTLIVKPSTFWREVGCKLQSSSEK
jgi:predicted nucleic acid-binding protein